MSDYLRLTADVKKCRESGRLSVFTTERDTEVGTHDARMLEFDMHCSRNGYKRTSNVQTDYIDKAEYLAARGAQS